MQLTDLNQFSNLSVNEAECADIFDANSRKVVDIEKPAIIDFADGNAPVRKPIVLPLQQTMERCRVTGTVS